MGYFCLQLQYYCVETVSKCLWLQMVRMEMDCNLKN